jgi:hypothetical protein
LTFVASSHNGAASGTSVTVDTPTGAIAGDLLLAYCQATGAAAYSTPSGWTEVVSNTGGHVVYARFHDGSSSDYTFTTSGSVAQAVLILAYRGLSFGIGSTVSGATANPTPPTITVPANDSINITFAGSGTAAVTYSMPSGWTQRAVRNTNRSIVAFERDATVSSGSLAGVQVTRTSGSANGRAMQVSIAPTPTGGLIKVRIGSDWVEKPVKVYLAGNWVEKPLKRWDGSAWVPA